MQNVKNIFSAFFFSLIFLNAHSQYTDWRNVNNGSRISVNGYCDQPYVSVLKSGKWLVTYTTNAEHEGKKGQHIVSAVSSNHGVSWENVTQIEPPSEESASWAMPYVTKYGRIYVFYNYNGDKIHELNDKKGIREDMLGWYCYKYSDDDGKTWSERYRLDVPKTAVDFTNDWQGNVQILWGIGKPVDVDRGMMFAFSKIGKYVIDDTEGWFFRCDNINSERNVSKLKWKMLPQANRGLKNHELGPISEEQNIFQMNNGTIYCMQRTISGHPAESYSFNGGKSWTTPKVPEYMNGIKIRNPRACPRIWKCKNGKYLFWYHHHGGTNFTYRNPAWISGGIERNGKIIWGQPEIFLFEDDIAKRMSYPDLIEQDGKYWITETNKQEARVHEIPVAFLNKIWSQFEINAVTAEGLVAEWEKQKLAANTTLQFPENKSERGFTINFKLLLSHNISEGQVIISAKCANGKTVEIVSDEYASVKIILNDGIHKDVWNADPGLISSFKEHEISVIIDDGPKIIQFVVDGKVCNGRDLRQYGWSRYKADMSNLQFQSITVRHLNSKQIGRPDGEVRMLRVYNRPLLNTEALANYKSSLNPIKNEL